MKPTFIEKFAATFKYPYQPQSGVAQD